ncbi:MAG: galactokinase [Anaerolineae bacterium]|nr:galactokinase [Anaerolineae bacterium]
MNSDTQLDALVQRVRQAFAQKLGTEPDHVIAAPGRVNLIGEHTDYNEGFVLPAAIDRHVVMAIRPRDDSVVRLIALDMEATSSFSLNDIVRDDAQPWSNYQRGVAWALQEAGYSLTGMDAALASDVPIGAGLSSSAAVELAAAMAFQTLGGLDVDGVDRAKLCQKAENEFVGMHCGIMDQYIISMGQRGHALLIDCRSLSYEPVPVPDGCQIVICNTNKPRELVGSAYNERRAECETGARQMGATSLRDITQEQLAQHSDILDSTVLKRCRHVVTENQRTLETVEALRLGDLARAGALMNASHVSLRDDYEVSCPELDAMVEAAWDQPGVWGARMTGAGFGGCTVNLVQTEAVEGFVQKVAARYQERTGLKASIYVCSPEEGVRLLS